MYKDYKLNAIVKGNYVGSKILILNSKFEVMLINMDNISFPCALF